VHDIEIDDAITEQIKTATPGLSFCDTEAQSKTLPTPFGSVIEQAAETFADLNQHGIVNATVFKPTPTIELLDAQRQRPLPLETQPKATFQIRCSFLFQYSKGRAANFVVFKHRWRWKFSWWWPPWVPIIGGTRLRHLSRMKPPFGNPNLSHDPWVNEPAITCSAQRRGGRRWPWMHKLSAWGSLAGASGRFTLNRLELRSWAVLEIHMAGAGADDILDDFALREAVLSKCKPVPMEWALQLFGLLFWVLYGPAVGHLSTRQLSGLGFAIAGASAGDAVWASNYGIFNSFR
jgi:hypothetical protein